MEKNNISNIVPLIPAYMPEKSLLKTAADLYEAGFMHILVVDDGSGQEYSKIFDALPEYVSLVRHEANKGKGEAIKTGLKYIQEKMNFCKGIVTCDADGQHAAEDIINVSETLIEHPDDLVLGSRAFDKDVPARSRFGNSLTRTVFFLASHVKVRDTQTGLRAFSSDMIPFMLGVEGSRYEYEINMLLAASREKINIREVTIRTIYLDGNSSSHFHVFRDSFLVYKNIIKFSCSSLVAFAVDFAALFIFKGIFGFMQLKPSVLLLAAVVAARVVSSLVNYLINRKLVFKNAGNNTLLKYYSLAVCILAANYGLMNLFNIQLNIPLAAAKIITEVLLFFVSYYVQKKFIFKRK